MQTDATETTMIDPLIRFFWEGCWSSGAIETRRRIFDCQLVYVSAGSADLDVEGVKRALVSGTVAIIPPGVPHQTFVRIGGEAVRHCIHFDWQGGGDESSAPLWVPHEAAFDRRLVREPPPEIARRLPLIVDTSQDPLIANAIQLMLCFLRNRDPLASKQLAVILQWLLAKAEKGPATPSAGKDAGDRMISLLQHIQRHAADPLTHHDFCRLASLSSSSLCKAFYLTVGMRPLAYLNRVRIQNAQRILVEADIPIAEVARQVGFGDLNYFCRLFRREAGMTPSHFRDVGRRNRHCYLDGVQMPDGSPRVKPVSAAGSGRPLRTAIAV